MYYYFHVQYDYYFLPPFSRPFEGEAGLHVEEEFDREQLYTSTPPQLTSATGHPQTALCLSSFRSTYTNTASARTLHHTLNLCAPVWSSRIVSHCIYFAVIMFWIDV